MAVTPDQAVISFIANAEGKWRLSRVRRWLDKEPEEQTITVPGRVLGDRKQWAPWSAKLEVTPDGKFAICVTSAFRVGPAGRDQDEFVSVVNLLDFKVVSSIHASEVAALSGGYRTYGVDRAGHLISQAFTPFPRHPGDDASLGGSRVKLTALSLPDLAVVDQCQYSEWMRSGAIVRREGEQDCAKLLGGRSLPDFLTALVDTDELRRNGRLVSRDGLFERESRQKSHRGFFWGNIVVTELVESIFSAHSGELLGSVKEPTHSSVRSRFASMNGRDYLLLMEGGTRLVIYEITE